MAGRRPGNRVAMGIGLVVGLLLLGWLAPWRTGPGRATTAAASPSASASAPAPAPAPSASAPGSLPGSSAARSRPLVASASRSAPSLAPEPEEPSDDDALEAGDAAPPAPDAEQVRALLERGEAAFNDGDLAGATDAFRRIVEDAPDSRYGPYAAYKLAWCTYNAGDLRGASVEMERALAWLEAGDAPGADLIAQEAAKDLARFRAELAAPPSE